MTDFEKRGWGENRIQPSSEGRYSVFSDLGRKSRRLCGRLESTAR